MSCLSTFTVLSQKGNVAHAGRQNSWRIAQFAARNPVPPVVDVMGDDVIWCRKLGEFNCGRKITRTASSSAARFEQRPAAAGASDERGASHCRRGRRRLLQ
jgi:hypothetical protein